MYKFSDDLALEYNPFGIHVQCVLPAFVATKMSGIRKPSLLAPPPNEFARLQMKAWGLEVSSPGYWFHKLQVCAVMKHISPVPKKFDLRCKILV